MNRKVSVNLHLVMGLRRSRVLHTVLNVIGTEKLYRHSYLR